MPASATEQVEFTSFEHAFDRTTTPFDDTIRSVLEIAAALCCG